MVNVTLITHPFSSINPLCTGESERVAIEHTRSTILSFNISPMTVFFFETAAGFEVIIICL